MATNEPLQLNLGSLRSAMSLTLHTHHASRIWHGRAAAEGRPGIVGLNGYIAVMNKMKRGSEQDDPYSDWWMLRIEEKLDQTKATLQSLREQVDQALADVPAALSLGENLNVQPVKLPLFVNAQLGFAAVYLLADYDDIARKLILAHHTALIDRSTLERWLNEGAHALRSLFSLAQQYYEKPTNWTLIGDGTGHRRQMNWMRAPEALDSAANLHFPDLATFVFRMDSPLSASLWLL
ncbi:PFL_4669 family integrating conjugative element protein [Xanthomonas arboricola pv. corylina]|uniref:PFL_4669 family integrating conjugative element protein n=1 Tax=Xanthomonas arboricola TaxID=56448 RepID=UPI0031BB7548